MVRSFIALHSIIHPRATTEFIYRYNSASVAHIFISFKLESTNREKEVSSVLEALENGGMKGYDISDDEMSKSHARYMIGGCADVKDERLFRFGTWRYKIFNWMLKQGLEFPERPGALRKFLVGLHKGWNITLFHYRNHGAGTKERTTLFLIRTDSHVSYRSRKGLGRHSGAPGRVGRI